MIVPANIIRERGKYRMNIKHNLTAKPSSDIKPKDILKPKNKLSSGFRHMYEDDTSGEPLKKAGVMKITVAERFIEDMENQLQYARHFVIKAKETDDWETAQIIYRERMDFIKELIQSAQSGINSFSDKGTIEDVIRKQKENNIFLIKPEEAIENIIALHSKLEGISIQTSDDAEYAMAQLEEAVKKTSLLGSNLGATKCRLEHMQLNSENDKNVGPQGELKNVDMKLSDRESLNHVLDLMR